MSSTAPPPDPKTRTAAHGANQGSGKPQNYSVSDNATSDAAMQWAPDPVLGRRAALELYAGAPPDPEGWAQLAADGVELDHVTDLTGPIVRHPVTFRNDGLFDYDYFGEQAFCVVARDLDDATPIDIIAWSIRDPQWFAPLIGQAGLLGAAAIVNPASYMAGICPLWRTPLKWLQERCRGAVVTHERLCRPILARAPGLLACEDLEHAHDLIAMGAARREQLRIPNPIFAVRVAA